MKYVTEINKLDRQEALALNPDNPYFFSIMSTSLKKTWVCSTSPLAPYIKMDLFCSLSFYSNFVAMRRADVQSGFMCFAPRCKCSNKAKDRNQNQNSNPIPLPIISLRL